MKKKYEIDWGNYLSEKRYRESSKKDGGKTDSRTPFERDYGRVLFSSAIRRMHDKTQVIPLTNGDSVLTRLTHSIHVMDLAESLIMAYCRDNKIESSVMLNLLAISKTAAFVHDVGNPPFGHFGETVIQDYFRAKEDYLRKGFLKDDTDYNSLDLKVADFTQFDGNAQGFRVLTRLQYIGSLSGLNLSYATLGAYLKYPNVKRCDKSYIGSKKHGVFYSEHEIFEQITEECHLKTSDSKKIKRHPLSFIVEAADSIAYRVMDIEDGFNLGWYSFEEMFNTINEHLGSASILEIINFAGDARPEHLSQVGAQKKAMVDFRVALIQYLVDKAKDNFQENLEKIDTGEYSKELIHDDDNKVEEALSNFTVRKIFSQKSVAMMEMTGRSVIEGLLEILSTYAFHPDKSYRERFKNIISPSLITIARHEDLCEKNKLESNKYHYFTPQEINKFDIGDLSMYERWKIIVDYVSGMTDRFAVDLYQQLSGQKI